MLAKIGESLSKKNSWLITGCIATFIIVKIEFIRLARAGSILWSMFGQELLGLRKLIATAGVVFLIPALFSFFISDKTRVGIAISAAVLLLTWKKFLEHAQSVGLKNQVYFERIGLTVLLLILTPSLYIDRFAELRLTYKEFINLIL